MRVLLAIVLVLFSAYTAWVAFTFGYTSVFEVSLQQPPSTQVLIDLWLAGALLMLVMVADNRRSGRPFRAVVPYLIVGAFTGVIGALLYFVVHPELLRTDPPRS